MKTPTKELLLGILLGILYVVILTLVQLRISSTWLLLALLPVAAVYVPLMKVCRKCRNTEEPPLDLSPAEQGRLQRIVGAKNMEHERHGALGLFFTGVFILLYSLFFIGDRNATTIMGVVMGTILMILGGVRYAYYLLFRLIKYQAQQHRAEMEEASLSSKSNSNEEK